MIILLLSLFLLILEVTNGALSSQKLAVGTIKFNTTLFYSLNDDGTTCSVNKIICSKNEVKSITIPVKVKLNSSGIAIEQDLDGSAIGDDWISVTGIGNAVFQDLTELTDISSYANITYIGDDSFKGCSKLSIVDIDFSKVTYVGSNAITDTAYYQGIYNNANDEILIDDIFFGFKQLKSGDITLNNYRIIASNALSNQSNITSVKLPSSCVGLGNNVFYNCGNLVSVDTTLSNLTNVGEDAFNTNAEYPLIVKTNFENTFIQNNTRNGTPIAINHDWTFGSPGFYSGRYQTMNFNFSVQSMTNPSNSRNISEINKTYTFETNVTEYILDNEKYILYSNVAPVVNLSIAINFYNYTFLSATEEIACFYTKNGEKIVDFATDGGAKNYYSDTILIEYNATLEQNYEHTLNLCITSDAGVCFAGDSKIQLADGTYKLAKDIEYDDLLLCYNFDEGRFAESYPVWITKETTTMKYYLVEFEDGTYFKSIISHRIYSTDENKFVKSIDAMFSQEGHNILKLAVDEEGNAIRDEDGNFMHTISKIKKITKVIEEVQVVNIVTTYQLNHYINGVLGSTGFSNMYSFDDVDENNNVVHNQEELYNRQNGVDTMYTFNDFAGLSVTLNQFIGWRIAELKGVRTIADINTYILNAYDGSYAYPTDDNGNVIYKLSTSDGYSVWVRENENYTLPTPNAQDGKTFVGWYNNANGKYYNVGDTISIYLNTHFTAIWK